jgi:uncharacterized HAD superfamily protein
MTDKDFRLNDFGEKIFEIDDKNCYFVDIDGTIVEMLTWDTLESNSKIDNFIQELLPGVKEFFENAEKLNHTIIFTTGRSECYREMTIRTLKFHNIKYKSLIMDLPIGKRYLINDTVNVMYPKSIGINVLRNTGFGDPLNFNPGV